MKETIEKIENENNIGLIFKIKKENKVIRIIDEFHWATVLTRIEDARLRLEFAENF